jgi:hypothetical protein
MAGKPGAMDLSFEAALDLFRAELSGKLHNRACDLGEAWPVRVNRIVVCRVQFQQLDVDPRLLQPFYKGF